MLLRINVRDPKDLKKSILNQVEYYNTTSNTYKILCLWQKKRMSVQSWTQNHGLSVLEVVSDKGFGCIVSLDHTALPRYWIHSADWDAEAV